MRTLGCRRLGHGLGLGLLLSFCCVCAAAPPRVVNASPDNADIGVDPTLKQLRIEFDQDMRSTGQSLCGGGPTFPTVTGKAEWVGTRTVIVPISLEPGKSYALSVNCQAAGNFRGVNGESAEPYSIRFTTRKEGEVAPSLTPAQTKAAIATLETAVRDRYSYRDLRKVDWDAEFARARPAMERSDTPAAFARSVASFLTIARDMHITVRVDDVIIPNFRASVQRNYDLKLLEATVRDWKRPSQRIATGTVEGVPYLLIGDWQGQPKEYEPAFEFLAAHRSDAAIIVDVRTNGGGDEMLARTVAGCFVEKPTVYSRNKSRASAAADGWTQTMDRVVEPARHRPHFAGRVAVLIGNQCMSSNESFVLMLKHGASGGAILVGEATYGSSGNPRPVQLCDHVSVALPTWVDMLPDGTPLEGVGVPPDVRVEWKRGGPADDPVLRAAVEALRKK